MEQHEASLYNQAIALAKMGHREQAYAYFRRIARTYPRDLDIVLWLMFTAPDREMAQAMLDRAFFINSASPAVQEADQWLTNEKLNLPQPAQGFKHFPPANTQTQVVPTYTTRPGDPYSYYPSQTLPALPPPSMPTYQNPPTAQYYPAPPTLPAPYQPYQTLPPAPYSPPPPPNYYQPYQNYSPYPAPGPAYAPYNYGQPQNPYYPPQQNYMRPYYPPYAPPPVYNPPVRWNANQSPSYAYNNVLSMGRNYRCPYCNTPYPPTNSRRISTSGWVTFAIFAGLFFPLCWIGLLMQENYLRCSYCHLVLT